MEKMGKKTLRLAAVGDLLLTSPDGETPGRGIEALSDDIIDLFKSCDIVFANLECTLPGSEKINTEPRVLSSETQIRTLSDSGINIVSLGNNHTFDCFDEGFLKLGALLNDMGIRWAGAGMNLEEALNAPILEINGIKLAFLCVVDPSSGMYRFAGKDSSGVAPLETKAVCNIIKRLKQNSDHVIVSPHWGMERFRIPSLMQIEQAKEFVDAGASMVLGHHPHVLQGMEFYREAPVVYSLGNFIANTVYWTSGNHLTWNRFESTGCIFLAEMDSTAVYNARQVPVFDDGKRVTLDQTGWGEACLNKVNHLLKKGVTEKRYRREAFYVATVKPILSHLRWAKFKQIRPMHFIKLVRHLYRSIFSQKGR